MLSNAYFLAKFRFDTAENEPAKNLQNLQNLPILLTLTHVDCGLGRHFEENPAERADDRRPVHVEFGSLQDLRHVQGQDFRALEDNRSSVVVPLGEQAKFSEPVAHNLRLSRAAAFFEKTEYLPRNFEPSTS